MEVGSLVGVSIPCRMTNDRKEGMMLLSRKKVCSNGVAAAVTGDDSRRATCSE